MASTQPPGLIAPYIKALQELDRGVRAPKTAMQLHFVKVCRGVSRPATEYERLYLEWRAREQRRLKLEAEEQVRQREINSNRSGRMASAPPRLVPGRWSDPKPYARFVAEPLGTREDFKTDRAANLAASRPNKL